MRKTLQIACLLAVILLVIGIVYLLGSSNKQENHESLVWGVHFNISVEKEGKVETGLDKFQISDELALMVVNTSGTEINGTYIYDGANFVIVNMGDSQPNQFNDNPHFYIKIGDDYEYNNITIRLNNITGSPCPKGSYC